jgi:hypothetical protein
MVSGVRPPLALVSLVSSSAPAAICGSSPGGSRARTNTPPATRGMALHAALACDRAIW